MDECSARQERPGASAALARPETAKRQTSFHEVESNSAEAVCGGRQGHIQCRLPVDEPKIVQAVLHGRRIEFSRTAPELACVCVACARVDGRTGCNRTSQRAVRLLCEPIGGRENCHT